MIVIAFRIDGKSPIQPENQQLIGLPPAIYRCVFKEFTAFYAPFEIPWHSVHHLPLRRPVSLRRRLGLHPEPVEEDE